MALFVVDASVGVKWCLPASGVPLSSQALSLLARFHRGEDSFLVPGLFFVEVANALWKLVRFAGYPPDQAAAALDRIVRYGLTAVPTRDVLIEAFRIAVAHNRSVYDCMYVSLAVVSRANLITADEKLVNAMGARFPIKWLGACELM